VLKFDSLGNKVWAKQLSITNGTLNGSSIIESIAHDFYVASYDNLFNGYLTKLDAAGNIAWTHKWTASSSGGASGLKLFLDVNNNIVFAGLLANSYFVARLDANGGGCGFVNSTSIASSNANTVLTNISFTTTVFAPSTTNENIIYTAQGYTESMICGGVGIEEEMQKGEWVIYPNPGGNQLAIGSRQFAIKTIAVYNMIGDLELAVSLTTANCLLPTYFDVSSLTPGIYLVRVSDGEKNYTTKFIKE
ncbi:MAG: T9SS type A sorting domain-containing protein, partial [Bacteroidota bacterium]